MSRMARENPEPDEYERRMIELVEDARQDRIDALVNGEGEDG